MIKLIGTILNILLSPMGDMYGLCEPIAKLLSKMFWIGAFLGFNPDNETTKKMSEKLEEKHEKCRENETYRKVEDGLGNTLRFIERLIQLIFDVIMILCTGGLWIFWMLIRKKIRKNKKRA